MTRSADHEWTIGELAKAAGVTVRTLHHYDRLGLLVPSERSSGSHRRYGNAEVRCLYRILALRGLGFPLATIGELLDSDDVAALRRTAARQLELVEQQLKLHKHLRDRLTSIIEVLDQPVWRAHPPTNYSTHWRSWR